MQPEYILLADSQPLFQSDVLKDFLAHSIRRKQLATGVYIGASNHDRPEFYQLAVGAFERFSITRHCHLQAADERALDIIDEPALIILAGGELSPGWRYLNQAKVRGWLVTQQQLGSVFVGISAGAIHLTSGIGHSGLRINYLNWFDIATTVHEEAEQWPSLSAAQQAGVERVIGIPFGEGVIISADRLTSLQGRVVLAAAGHTGSSNNLTIAAHRQP